MANRTTTGYITDPQNTNDHKRTTTGRDFLKLPGVPCTTLLQIEISDTATVDIEYSEGNDVYIKVATITATSGIQFAIPATILSVHVTEYTSGYVRVLYRTVELDNFPSQTLILYGTSITSPIVSTTDHGSLSGLLDDDHTQYVLRSILTNDGDLFVRSGGVIARLPKGTDGQVLTMVSGAPAWA
jgi:hypothetical protein